MVNTYLNDKYASKNSPSNIPTDVYNNPITSITNNTNSINTINTTLGTKQNNITNINTIFVIINTLYAVL